MPFIEPKNRDRIKLLGPEGAENVGDLCFIFYDHIMKVWREEPRWRTAHRMFDFEADAIDNEFFQFVYEKVEKKFELKDVAKAAALAYKVFFQRHAMKYEFEKMRENGDI